MTNVHRTDFHIYMNSSRHSWQTSSERQNNDCRRCRVGVKRKGDNVSAMTIHNLYIFSKTGTLLYYAEWNRLNKSGITKEEVKYSCSYGHCVSIRKTNLLCQQRYAGMTDPQSFGLSKLTDSSSIHRTFILHLHITRIH